MHKSFQCMLYSGSIILSMSCISLPSPSPLWYDLTIVLSLGAILNLCCTWNGLRTILYRLQKYSLWYPLLLQALFQHYCVCHATSDCGQNLFQRAQNHSVLTHQRATKLSVLFQPYLLSIIYITFQYLTVSCIPPIGHVPNLSRYT